MAEDDRDARPPWPRGHGASRTGTPGCRRKAEAAVQGPALRRREICSDRAARLPQALRRARGHRAHRRRLRLPRLQARYGPHTVCGTPRSKASRRHSSATTARSTHEGSVKAAQFIQLCCQSGTPIVFLQNTTGYIVGTEAERGGIVKHGSKMIQAVTNADRAEADPPHRRLVRRRQLRHVRARLRSALHLRLAEQPHRGDGRRTGGEGDDDHRREKSQRDGKEPPRSRSTRCQAIVDQFDANRPRSTRPRGCGTTASSIRATRAACSPSHRRLPRSRARQLRPKFRLAVPERSSEAWRFHCDASVLTSARFRDLRHRPEAGQLETVQVHARHAALRQTWKTLIDREINPHVDEWEKAQASSRRTSCSRRWATLGFLGVNKPEKFGGSGLDYSYAMICRRRSARSTAVVPMAIGVQTAMATPALARFGTDELRGEFLAPSISGDYVACLGVSEVGAGSDVASIKTNARQRRRRLRHQRRQDVDDQRRAGRLDVPAGQHRRRPVHKNKTMIVRADEDQGHRRSSRSSTSSACAPRTRCRPSSTT